MARELNPAEVGLAFKGEQDPNELAAMLLQRARDQISQAKLIQKTGVPSTSTPSSTAIDYGTLFKGSKEADLSKLRPSIRQRPSTFQKLTVTLAELYEKREKPVRLIVEKVCNQCNGKRTVLDKDFTCTTCHGKGEITSSMGAFDFAVPYQRTTRCGACAGEGILVQESDRCWQCLGSGLIAEPKVVKVPLANVDLEQPKTPIILPQQGNESVCQGEAPGDLEFVLEILDHPNWTLLGRYYYCFKKIPVLNALIGRPFEITLFGGDRSLIGFCRHVLQHDQLVVNEQAGILVRIVYSYPEELVDLEQQVAANPVSALQPPDGAIEFSPPSEQFATYYWRQWGNRQKTPLPLE